MRCSFVDKLFDCADVMDPGCKIYDRSCVCGMLAYNLVRENPRCVVSMDIQLISMRIMKLKRKQLGCNA